MAGGMEGLDQLMKKYGRLAEQVIERGMEEAIGSAIEMVQAEAKLLCPVGDGELRQSILTNISHRDGKTIASAYTNKKYAPFVEFGTGPKGEADHAGISPAASPAYSQSAWWVHESQIEEATAERYSWSYIDTPDGRFYQTSGQAAQPFMYPALKNNQGRAVEEVARILSEEIRRICE